MNIRTEQRFSYTDPDSGIEFQWAKGEAGISIGHTQDQGVAGIYGDDFHAHDFIDAWGLPYTREAFETACRHWCQLRPLDGDYRDGPGYPYEQFNLRILLGNDSMREPRHIADALRRVAQQIDNSHGAEGTIMDNDGNAIGKFETK